MKSKYLFSLASLLLLFVFLFPIWRIDLEAPQYPEGIGLKIWVNQITGKYENDLENINRLNHYIGMKKIDSNSIPELTYMPYIIIFFVVTGLIFGLIGKRKLYLSWIVGIIITLLVGLYDYYMWGYDYGHNLNPHAAIKIPGMAYQPPLIGSKQILNMYSTSIPDVGTYFISLAVLLAFYAFYKAGKEEK